MSLIVSMIASSGAISTAQALESTPFEYTDHATIRINNETDLVALKASGNCTGSGTADDPYAIEGLNITGEGGICIFVGNTTSHLVVRDCYLHDANYFSGAFANGAGVLLYNVTNATVVNSDCRSNYYGIYLYKSYNNCVTGNNCNNSGYSAIFLKDSDSNIIQGNSGSDSNTHGIYLTNSNGNTVANNDCIDGTHGTGICLDGTSNQNVIENNTCVNDWQGIYLYTSCENMVVNNTCLRNINNGLVLYVSSSNVVRNNNFSENGGAGGITYYGIYVANSQENTIENNVFIENDQYCIYLDTTSSANSIYGNCFIDNNAGGVQANDLGTNNWNTSTYGNYWSDWTTPDYNEDGIVDSAYVIDANTFDYYPLANEDAFAHVVIETPVESSVDSPTVLVTGVANPDCELVVNGVVVSVNDDGSFAVVLALVEGNNTIEARSSNGFSSATDSVVVAYADPVPGLEDEIADLQDQLNDLQNQIDELNASLTSTNGGLTNVQGDVSDLQGNSLPLVLGIVGLLVGVVALALVLVLRKK